MGCNYLPGRTLIDKPKGRAVLAIYPDGPTKQPNLRLFNLRKGKQINLFIELNSALSKILQGL